MLRSMIAGLSFLAATFSADARDVRMVIVNNTDYTIEYLYGSNTGQESWGYDLLGDSVIPPHSRMMINFEDNSGYCRYDLQARFSNGHVGEDYRVNVCEVAYFTYN